MNFELLLLVGPLVAASILSLITAIYVLKKDYTPSSTWFSILMIMITIWTTCYALELVFFNQNLVLLFAKLKYIGIVYTPVAWLFFSLSYTQNQLTISKKTIVALLILPTFLLITLFTNPFHHLFWKSISITGSSTISIANGSSNVFFWIHTIYSYSLIVLGTAFILMMLFRTKEIFTKQNMSLLFGVLAPFIGNIFIVFNFIRTPYGYDITPLLFVISGVAFSTSILFFKFLELIPTAREEVFEYVPQAIFVLNKNMLIVDTNKSAENLVKHGFFPVNNERIIGTSIDSLFKNIFPNGVLEDIGFQKKLIQMKSNEDRICFEIALNPLFDEHNSLEGHLITIDDVTHQKKIEEKLKEKISELEQFKEVTVDRELKMVELKREISQLKKNTWEE